jgi:ABC-type dipeptide/oligopeptide/nickel transport system ATPase component
VTNNATSNNITNNTTNTATTINNNNTTVINVFRKEDVSYIPGDRIKQLNTSDDLNEAVLEVIKLTHFNKEHPENMNIFVPQGADFALVYSKTGTWERTPLHSAARSITYDAGCVMLDHVTDHEQQYKKKEVKRVEGWYDTLGNIASVIQNAEQVARDNSAIVMQTCRLE